MTDILITAIKCLAAVLLGVFEGNGAVYFFNKMPPKWFCDYGQEPTDDLLDPYTQRVKSYPWKFLFTMLFIVINIWMVMDSIQFAVASSLAIWLLLELSISDIKYRIVPDELLVLLALTSLGFLPYQGSWQKCLVGAALGFGIMLLVGAIGKAAYKRDTLGGGDMKLFGVIGLIVGPTGVLIVIMITSLLSAGHACFLLATKKIKKSDSLAMVPYISIATAVYLIFLWGRFEHLIF